MIGREVEVEVHRTDFTGELTENDHIGAFYKLVEHLGQVFHGLIPGHR